MDSFPNLISEAKQGSTEALGNLLLEARAYLLAIANENLNSELQAKMGASDVVSEVFLQVIQSIEALRGSSREEFFGWLVEILKSKERKNQRAYATWKRNASKERSLDNGNSERNSAPLAVSRDLTPSTAASAKEEKEKYDQAIARLTGELREILLLREEEELSFDAIATHLGLPATSVRRKYSKAWQMLHKEMTGQ